MPKKTLQTETTQTADQAPLGPELNPWDENSVLSQTDVETVADEFTAPRIPPDESSILQTETDDHLDDPKAPAELKDPAFHQAMGQTDAGHGKTQSAEEEELALIPPDEAIPQTRSDSAPDSQTMDDADAYHNPEFPAAQIDTNTGEITAESAADQGLASETHLSKIYTGSSIATSEKTDRRQTNKTQTAAQSDAEGRPASGSDPDEPAPLQSGEAAKEPNQPRQSTSSRRRPRRVDPIVSIDERRSVETDADKLQNDLLDLVESLKGRKILSGTIQGVERSADNPNLSFAVVYHGEFKVIIPAVETVEPPEDFRDRVPGDVMHYLVTKRLGAEIDFIIKGVDAQTGIAAASRLEAMAAKRREYYFGTDRDGNNLLYEGISAEARVVSVIRAGIFIDLFGVESYIALRELSYQRWVDASAHFQPGQRVLVKILSIDRSDRNHIRVSASVKQAGENPYEKALRRYSAGSRYVGTVSMVDTNGVFVSLDGGVDCLCSYPKRGRPPRGARVTVRIIGINNENNRIWGAITHMTTPR